MHMLLKKQMVNTVYVGYDPKEHTAYEVLKFSLERISTKPVRVIPLRRDILTKIGIYTRKHNSIGGQDYDEIDGKPFSTQFSFSRFLIPALNPDSTSLNLSPIKNELSKSISNIFAATFIISGLGFLHPLNKESGPNPLAKMPMTGFFSPNK